VAAPRRALTGNPGTRRLAAVTRIDDVGLLTTLATDSAGNKHVPATGNLEFALSWRSKLTDSASRSPLWGQLKTGSGHSTMRSACSRTIVSQNSALTFLPVIEPQSVTYDTVRDLVPLGISSRTPSVLVVRSDAPYRTLAAVIEHAKMEPGSVRIGHPGRRLRRRLLHPAD